jgi:site-specific DNA-methyltransferase (adenine-specific)
MEKSFENEILTLYNNSLNDINLEELDFNYIITDPPYNIKYKYPDYKDNLSDDDYIKLLSCMEGYKSVVIHYPEGICNYVCEALGKVQKIISWCYNNNGSSRAHRSIAFFNTLPDFNKVKQPYKNPTDKRIAKLIANGSKGARSYDWFNDIQMIKNVSKEKCKDFTNQIPIELLERIILLTTNEGDTILDPFFGSGSIYQACINTKRKCIGIEISKEHIDIFMKRFSLSNEE